MSSASASATASRSSLSLSFATGLDDTANDTGIDNDRWTALDDSVDVGGEGASEGSGAAESVDWRVEEEWNSTYTLRLPLVPTSFVPHG